MTSSEEGDPFTYLLGSEVGNCVSEVSMPTGPLPLPRLLFVFEGLELLSEAMGAVDSSRRMYG